jgi:thiol-disulfide isomerase/thioredoxin
MYRKLIYSIFIISICCNIYCGFNYYQKLQDRRWAAAMTEHWNVKNVSSIDGNNFIFEKIKNIHPEFNQTKKYYFISIWNTMCVPCIREMPLLDTLADNINRNDFAYMFVTENGERMINQSRKKHNINSRNFSFINDADVYISSVLKNQNLENRQYPIQLIIDNKGDIKYFQVGTIESATDSVIINCVKGLKE